MILDPQNALFKDDWLVHDEVAEDLIEQVTVGVDPYGGGDEVGIVATALLNDGRFAVLADRSTSGSPAQWGEAVVRCHDDFDEPGTKIPGGYGCTYTAAPTPKDAVRCFREYMDASPARREAARRELRGKDVVCYCGLGEPCHGDVLLAIANN